MSRVVVVAVALSLLALLGALSVPSAAGAHPAPSSTPAARAPHASPSVPSGAPRTPTLSSPTPGFAARASLQSSVLSSLRTAGVPTRAIYLPNFEGGGVLHGNVVAPITKVAPAPMGLGDFGVVNTTGTPHPYVIDASSWEGTVTLNSGDFFYLDNDGPDTFGVQLNAVLSNVTVFGAPNDDYWIQDVMYYTPSTSEVQFLDNIWNLSNPATTEPSSTFYAYNGTPVSPEFYYDFGPTFTTAFPFTAHLYVNASLTNLSGKSYSTVRFGYDLVSGSGSLIGHGIYDTVLFNSNVAAGPSVPLPQFQVNGGRLTPTNFLLYDTELMIGGPGGGSTTQVYALNGTMQIAYLNRSSGKYTDDPSAWTAGTDTGETSQGVSESYTTPGTVDLGAGPSFVEPLWNATPGGNAGVLRLTGTLSPDNAFIFLSPGGTFNNTTAAWAPTLPGGTYTFYLPPGAYAGKVLLSNHDTRDVSFLGGAGTTSTVDVTLTLDLSVGLDTPLFAWDNSDLAGISYSGAGTVNDPYLLYNDQIVAMPALFGEMNDFLFPVFPGVLISGTTAYFDLASPPPFTVLYPVAYDARLTFNSLPDTNQLQIELYDTSHGSITDGSDIGGWICGCQFGPFPEVYYPDGEIVLWGATDTLVAGNVFQDEGVGIVLMQGSDNVVFGNEFLNGLIGPATFPAQFGIWEFESGDLIYNNAFDTSVTAFSPSYNLYNGDNQTNRNSWNLTGWVPSSTVRNVNGFNLSGSLLGLPAVCGNWWWNYAPGSALPYNEPYGGGAPFIYTGGDYCPSGPNGTLGYEVAFSETGLASGNWSVTLAGVTGTAPAGTAIVFAMPNGTWSFSVGAVAGFVVSPASGSVAVKGHSAGVALVFSPPVTSVTPTAYLATISETGLAAGTAWSVAVNGTPYSTNGTTVALTLVNDSYPYTVSAVADYTLLSPASGAITIQGSSVAVLVRFSPDPGWLNVTVQPASSGASAWVDGGSVPLDQGQFALEEMPGIYAIEVTATGYATFFDNATVHPAGATALRVVLSALSSSPGGTGGRSNATSSSSGGLTNAEFYGLVGGLLAVAIAIVLAALLLRRRTGPPPAASAPVADESAGVPYDPSQDATMPAAEPAPEAPVYYEGPRTAARRRPEVRRGSVPARPQVPAA